MLEGEARFIRAWLYFNMARGMGGMPIIGDEVFEYSPVWTLPHCNIRDLLKLKFTTI